MVSVLGPQAGPVAGDYERELNDLLDRMVTVQASERSRELEQAILRGREALHWLWERRAQQLARDQR
jgi:hypothetical protein